MEGDALDRGDALRFFLVIQLVRCSSMRADSGFLR